MTPTLIARMPWPARRRLAQRRQADLRTAALEHYARYGDGPSTHLFRETPFAWDDPPTNISRPAIPVYELLNQEASAATHAATMLGRVDMDAPCSCHRCARERKSA